jgi:ATP-dependent RNA helicase DDX27
MLAVYHPFTGVSDTVFCFLITDLSKQDYLNASQAKASAKDNAPDPSAPRRDKFSGLSRRQKRRKMAAEADEEFNDKAVVDSAIRAAKHAQRPRKIGDDAPQPLFGKKNRKDSGKRKKPGHASAKTKILGKDSQFKAEMGAKRRGGGGGVSEGVRAKKGDRGVLGGKKGGKGGGKGKVKGRR